MKSGYPVNFFFFPFDLSSSRYLSRTILDITKGRESRDCVGLAPMCATTHQLKRLDAAEAIERKRRARAGIGRMYGSCFQLRCQLARWCNDWMTSIGRRVRRSVVIGGMVHGMTLLLVSQGGACGFVAAHMLHGFQTCMAWPVHQILFGLTC